MNNFFSNLIFSDSDLNGSSLLVHVKRVFQLMFHSGQWKWFLVNYKTFTFIQSFFLLVDTIHEVKCMPIFKEEHYSCSMKQFSWIFGDIPVSGSSFFRVVETEFSSNHSSPLANTDFGLISNRVLLFRVFFCCWKALLKLCENQFSSIFSIPNSGSSFSGQQKRNFYQKK